METRENLSNYHDFNDYDNFFTLMNTPNGYIHIIYGHYHPDNDTLFVYRNVHNKQIQTNTLRQCMHEDLLKIKEDTIYRYNNVEDAVFVYGKLREQRRDV